MNEELIPSIKHIQETYLELLSLIWEPGICSECGQENELLQRIKIKIEKSSLVMEGFHPQSWEVGAGWWWKLKAKLGYVMSLGQVSETLSQNIKQKEGYSWLVEHLPSMHKALVQFPVPQTWKNVCLDGNKNEYKN